MKRNIYTFIQVIAAGLLITIKMTSFAFLFPLILVLLVPFRKLCLPFIFTEREFAEVKISLKIISLNKFRCIVFVFSLMGMKHRMVLLMMKLISMVKFIYQFDDPINIILVVFFTSGGLLLHELFSRTKSIQKNYSEEQMNVEKKNVLSTYLLFLLFFLYIC